MIKFLVLKKFNVTILQKDEKKFNLIYQYLQASLFRRRNPF